MPVKSGERGVRQSDAVFLHIKQFTPLFNELSNKIDMKYVKAVGVSVRPRSVEDSYMPVFVVGETFAQTVALSLGVPLYTFSHQDGHIMSGIYSCGNYELMDMPFIAVHISGGTTEILKAEYNGEYFKQEIIGGTKDISAGQFIDRVGVALGMNFPCGKELEISSQNSVQKIKLPISVDGCYMNFSGVETKTIKMVGEYDKGELCFAVLDCVARSMAKAINNAVLFSELDNVLVAGGVASNRYIRGYIEKNVNANVYFAEPELSTDNAVGISILAKYKMEGR